MNAKALYYKRFRAAQKNNIKYFRLLFNDHFVLFLLIALGTSILGYRQLLTYDTISSFGKPCLWQVFIVLWLLLGLQIGSLMTYFKPADRLFLLSQDTNICHQYFKSALKVSVAVSATVQLIFVGLLVPILYQLYYESYDRIICLLAFLIVFKTFILVYERYKQLMISHSRMLMIFEPNSLIEKVLFRFLMPMVFIVLILIVPSSMVFICTAILLIIAIFMIYLFSISKSLSYRVAMNWQNAIEYERKRQQRIQSFYASFADVPNKETVIKQRPIINWLIQPLTKSSTVMYRLYMLRFIRTQELFPLIGRLAFVGGILIYILKSAPLWLILVTSALFIYLVNFQFLPLYRSTQMNLWTRLIPVTDIQKERDFRKLARQLSIMTSLYFMICIVLGQNKLSDMALVGVSIILINIIINSIYLPFILKQVKRHK